MNKRPLSTSKKSSLVTQGKKFKGAVDAGTVYGVILLAILIGGGMLMLGNFAPNIASPDQGQQVIIEQPDDQSKHSDLQLKDFPGMTLTPTPTPSPTPTPTPTTPPPSTGTGGGTTCFVAGTKILMADKTQKNIENVKAGDKVMGYDGKKQVVETVLEMDAPIRDHHYDIHLADGTVIGVTDEHPLYTQDGWKSINPAHTANENPNLKVGKLVVGDKVLKSSGNYIAITAMKYYPGPVQAYNLKRVSGNNDFYADGVLAHNKGGSAPAAPGAL